MHIAIVGPSPVPFAWGGAESLLAGLSDHIELLTEHHVELLKLPSRERSFWELVDTYRRFWSLDLSHFDLVISTKYPAWMVRHPNHLCYMLHPLRGLYDTYHLCGVPIEVPRGTPHIDTILEYMERHAASTEPEVVAEFFGLLDRMYAIRAELPEHFWAFPGPLIRQIVRFLDGLALSPARIRRFCAISATVAGRREYFPPGADVEVIHPPSRLVKFENTGNDYLFTTSRLDGAKRVHLLVEAMKRARCRLPLRIAGTGPEEAGLRELAAGDPRIEFLGFVPDASLTKLYGGALGVLFTPYEEDYGLVTIEAMMSEKPVVTCIDSGGPLEFVTEGVTGHVVRADAHEIAARIDELAEHPERAARMGRTGRERVQHITWERTIGRLLSSSVRRTVTPSRAHRSRPKITVAVPFRVSPARGGGQVRVLELYRELGRQFDVELVTLDESDGQRAQIELAPGLKEIRVPKTPTHQAAETELARAAGGVPIGDIALTLLHKSTPQFADELARSMAQAALVVASHPFALPALLAGRGRQPLVYEAQDVEYALKAEALGTIGGAEPLLEVVRTVERDACRLSALVLCCAAEDAQDLTARYGLDPSRVIHAPNGVNVTAVPFIAFEERDEHKRAFGIGGQRIALFVGSWHPPNLHAADLVFEMARRTPEVTFLLVGSQCLALADRQRPANLGLAGILDDATLAVLLTLADVGLNPMVGGSGSNLKMGRYLAAGLPVIATRRGCRGYDVVAGTHVSVAPVEEFSTHIRALLADRGVAATLAWQGRRLMEDRYDWKRIAAGVADAFCDMLGLRRRYAAIPVDRLMDRVSRRMAEVGIRQEDSVVGSVAAAIGELVCSDGSAPEVDAGADSDNPLEARLASTGNMREDWDARARANARFFIECTHHATEEEFDRSGEAMLETVLLRDIALDPRAIVLEIGCGLGRLLKPLVPRARELHGVDVSEGMIAQARERLAAYPTIHLHHGSGRDLGGLGDAYFDFCFSFIVFQHVPDKAIVRTYLAEVSRVLKPGGLVRFQVDGRPYLSGADTKFGTWEGVAFAESEIRKDLQASGLDILETTGAETQYLIVTARRPAKDAANEAFALFLGPSNSEMLSEPAGAGWTPPPATNEFASAFLAQHASLPAEAYLRQAYRTVLGREPDPEGLMHYVTKLGTDALDRKGVLDELLHAPEFTHRARPARQAAETSGSPHEAQSRLRVRQARGLS
jgi:glycosyltransferase involved in cell wall biosynthesis/SAM-dependent methyltransferase